MIADLGPDRLSIMRQPHANILQPFLGSMFSDELAVIHSHGCTPGTRFLQCILAQRGI